MNNLERVIWYYFAGRVFLPKPRYFCYNATLRCDLFCKHCGIWRAKKRRELSSGEFEKILSDSLFQKVETAWLTGGEPTVRDDLIDLGKVIIKRFPSLKILGIATNAFNSDRVLEQARGFLNVLDRSRQGLFVHISLDGISGVYDRIRGKDRAFDRVMITLDGLKKLKKDNPSYYIELGFNCVIQPENVHHLDEVRKFARKEGIGITFNIVSITDQSFRNLERKDELTLSEEERQISANFLKSLILDSPKALAYLYKSVVPVLEGKKRARRCLSLYSTFNLECDGSLICCPASAYWLEVNFIDVKPSEFWKSKEANRLRRRVVNELCSSCTLSCSVGDAMSLSDFIRGGF